MRPDPNTKPLAPWELERITQSRLRRFERGDLYQQKNEVPKARRIPVEEYTPRYQPDAEPLRSIPAATHDPERAAGRRKRGGKAGGKASSARAADRRGITLHDAETLAEKGRRGAAATKAAASAPSPADDERVRGWCEGLGVIRDTEQAHAERIGAEVRNAAAPGVEDTPAGPQYLMALAMEPSR